MNLTDAFRTHRQQIRKILDFTRFALTGALAGLATLNTIALVAGFDLSRPVENVGMGVGATAMTILVKALHIA